MKMRKVLRRGKREYEKAVAKGSRARAARTLASRASESGSVLRVHLGCGPVHLDGWLNIDIERESAADVRVDLRNGLPLPNRSVSHVFSEHVFEHLKLRDGERLLADLRDSMIPSGVLRIAMPEGIIESRRSARRRSPSRNFRCSNTCSLKT